MGCACMCVPVVLRITSVAEAGQVLTSAVVPRLTDAAPFTNVGAKPLKDIDATWELHTVE